MDVAIKATPIEEHSWLSALLASRHLRLNGLTADRLKLHVWQSIVICSVKDRCGSVSSLTNLSHASPLTYVWVKVREIPQDGLHL